MATLQQRCGAETMTPYLMAVVGPSGSGKTSLIERLVPILKKRGLRVGTIKHAHDRIDLDRPGKDSWRYLKAGAEAAVVVGPKQILVVKKRSAAQEGLRQASENLPAELDLILLEGFHQAKVPQIAIADRAGRIQNGQRIIAVVSDRPLGETRCRPAYRHARRFRTRQIKELAVFIDQEWTKQWEASCPPLSQALSSVEV